MPARRDVLAFERRAARYEQGWLGSVHHTIADRTAAIALATLPSPRHVVDVGCGTGYLLRTLAAACPATARLHGFDPAAAMIAAASAAARDPRLTFEVGVAEQLPVPDHTVELMLSTTSFDHWSDQRAGLRECARALSPGGHLVLVDQISTWLLPSLIVGRRRRARTKGRVGALLRSVGFRRWEWHPVYALIIKAAVATA
ncbi:MAG: class I SAM-dependent methyltransferase [Trebonia sp.]